MNCVRNLRRELQPRHNYNRNSWSCTLRKIRNLRRELQQRHNHNRNAWSCTLRKIRNLRRELQQRHNYNRNAWSCTLRKLERNNMVSTVMPKEELGVETFQHLHGAVLRHIDGKFYIIAQSWNPGDIVILEQIME